MNLKTARIGDEIHVIGGNGGKAYQIGDKFVIIQVVKGNGRKDFYATSPRRGITMQRKDSEDKRFYNIAFTNWSKTFKLVVDVKNLI